MHIDNCLSDFDFLDPIHDAEVVLLGSKVAALHLNLSGVEDTGVQSFWVSLRGNTGKCATSLTGQPP